MAAIYTKRLAAARLDAAGLKVIYTNNELGIVVVRDIIMSNLHTAAQRLRVYITTGSLIIDLDDRDQVAPLTSTHLELRQELLRGETISMQSTAGPMTVLITGYVFD